MKLLQKFKISIIVGVLSGILIGLIDLIPLTICISVFLSFFPGLISAQWYSRKYPETRARSVAFVSFLTGLFCATIWAISKFILVLLLGGLGALSNYFGNDALTLVILGVTIILFLIICIIIVIIGGYNSLIGLIFFKTKKWYQAKKLEEEQRAKRISQYEVEKNYSDYIEAEYSYADDDES